MPDTKKFALVCALSLHVAALAAFFVFSKNPTPPAPKPFKLVAAAPIPELAPAQELLPLPTPPPQAMPKPPAPKPKPKPVAKKKAPSNKVRYDDFVKSHGKPSTPQVKHIRKPAKKVKVALPAFKLELPQLTTSTELSNDLLSLYASRIRSAVDGAWNPQESFADYTHPASIQFQLSPSGNLVRVQIQSSSGSKSFDQSILNAFNTLKKFPQPPGGQGLNFEMQFARS